MFCPRYPGRYLPKITHLGSQMSLIVETKEIFSTRCCFFIRENISDIGLGNSLAISSAIFGGIPWRIKVFLNIDFVFRLLIVFCVTKSNDRNASLEPYITSTKRAFAQNLSMLSVHE